MMSSYYANGEPEWLTKDNQDWADVESIYKEAVDSNNDELVFKCYHRYCNLLVRAEIIKLHINMPNSQIEELVLGATIYALDRRNTKYHSARGGQHYDKLYTWCYYSVKEYLHNDQTQFENRIVIDSDLVEV